MARALARLKAVTVARAKKPGLLADGGGLYLRIGPSGAKSWVFRYRRRDGERKGKLRDMGPAFNYDAKGNPTASDNPLAFGGYCTKDANGNYRDTVIDPIHPLKSVGL